MGQQRKIVESLEVDTAEKLFAALSPATGDLWRVGEHIDENRSWIFRGQANGADGLKWKLTPSAHRKGDPFGAFRLPRGAAGELRGLGARKRESELVWKFADIVDKNGLVVPGDYHEFRDSREGANIHNIEIEANPFPPRALVQMYGLAQHHGVPTRLLDWTIKPLIAAYFAAEPVACRRGPGQEIPGAEHSHFSLFAMNQDVVAATMTIDPRIYILTVPTATNSFLHAQGGLFSVVQHHGETIEDVLPSIDEVLEKHSSDISEFAENRGYSIRFPLLIEFLVPTKEACAVMTTLQRMGVTGASVYPGLAGVVKEMKEERFYQYRNPYWRQ